MMSKFEVYALPDARKKYLFPLNDRELKFVGWFEEVTPKRRAFSSEHEVETDSPFYISLNGEIVLPFYIRLNGEIVLANSIKVGGFRYKKGERIPCSLVFRKWFYTWEYEEFTWGIRFPDRHVFKNLGSIILRESDPRVITYEYLFRPVWKFPWEYGPFDIEIEESAPGRGDYDIDIEKE